MPSSRSDEAPPARDGSVRAQARAAYARAVSTSVCSLALLIWFGVATLDQPVVEAWRVPAVIVTATLALKIYWLRRDRS